MKRYFLYEFKKRAFVIGCLTFIATALYVTAILSTANFATGASRTNLWVISTIGGLLAVFVPVWLFKYKMKRRSVDLWYSLPIPHTMVLTVRFLIGLIAVFAPYTVAYWLGAAAGLTKAAEQMQAIYYLPQYFASLIPVYCIYAISAFVFTRANKVIDGLLFIAFWAFAVALVALVLGQLTSQRAMSEENEISVLLYNRKYFIISVHYLPFAPLDYVTSHFQQHIAGYMNIHAYSLGTLELVNVIVGFTITTLCAAGATAGLFLLERREQAENAEQISDSPFGYKTMLPLYTVCLAGVCASYILYVLIVAGAFFLTVAYKRTFKIGIYQAIVLASSAVSGIILQIIIHYV